MLKKLTLLYLAPVLLVAQHVQPSAKAASLGGSFITQHSLFCSFHNVAGLAFTNENSLAIGTRNNYLINELTDFYALANFGKTKKYSLAADFFYYGFSAYQQFEFGANYSTKIAENYSIGVRLKYAVNAMPQEQLTRQLLTSSIGFLGQSNHWRYGATAINILQSQWQGATETVEPTGIAIGLGYFFNKETAVTIDYYKYQNLHADVRFGINYQPAKQLDLRVGFSTLQPTFTFGVGILLPQVTVNIAAAWHQQLGFSPVIDGVYAW